MPELPDITLYVDAISRRVVGQTLDHVRIRSPFVLRTVDPPIDAAEGRRVLAVERLGKRIVLVLDHDLFLVVHLMIAGRFRWFEPGERAALGRIEQAALVFPCGTLVLTEAGTKKRASIHLVRGREALLAFSRGGIEPLACGVTEFANALQRENRTLKRALTDPSTLSGIGNAYGDEILHAARLSPLKLTGSLTPDELARLHAGVVSTLTAWIDRLRREFGLGASPPAQGRFPGAGDITAFRPDFAVHGRFGKPCPVCGTKVQRIVYAENECNYCPTCQTGGKVLADRSLSRLLKDDWPRSVEELDG